MGLCLSVALWKEELDAGGDDRAARRGHEHGEVVAGVEGGGWEYGVMGGDGYENVAAPAVAGVKRGAVAVAVAGGTPVRPIWQRKVPMGVKCRLPQFSGMILYDESGRPVCSGIRDRARDQEKHAEVISVLRDML
ncbi:hypothetical protein ACP70R_027695 [Stipagrostis hirtigluma subsp. patula]